jgi:hypothetical protein
MKEYLTVGELARTFGLDVQTLHYYDSIGLFQPARRTQNELPPVSLRPDLSACVDPLPAQNGLFSGRHPAISGFPQPRRHPEPA